MDNRGSSLLGEIGWKGPSWADTEVWLKEKSAHLYVRDRAGGRDRRHMSDVRGRRRKKKELSGNALKMFS